VSAASLAVVACNLVTGVTDLQVSDGVTPFPLDGGSRDGSADQVSPPLGEGGALPDASGADAGGTPGDGGCVALAPPTKLLGVASALTGFYQLTPETNGLAGAIASASPLVLDAFDASFAYSITYSNSVTPGAGLAFFAIESSDKGGLPCQPGPNLCTLGGASPGFAVILRTSKGVPSDPTAPYVAVVDATSFPTTQPAITVPIDPAKAYSQASTPGQGLPPPATFHVMSISVRAGKVSASIDGAPVLTSASIPGWAPGRMVTWGVGASTGIGNGFAQRTVVGQVSLNACP
jgi:hypothetical protein